MIFVVDSSDYSRIDEARDVLNELLSHEKIAGKPVLLLANKQDCQEALDELEIVETLELEYLVNRNRCPTMVETCAATEMNGKSKVDPGIQKGYRWLMNFIIREYQNLNVRVERDVKQQELEEQEARLETIERIKKLSEANKRDDDIIESYSDYDRKVNGEIKNLPQNSFDDQKEIFYIHTSFNNGDTTSYSSSKSNESFPHAYFEHIEYDIQQERPKSAVQLVKQQLELENVKRRHSIKALISNKTAPVNLYGIRQPHSANERREHFANERRALKSAGDTSYVVTNLPNSIIPEAQGDELHHELFQLNNFQKMQKLPPLKVKAMSCNGEQSHWVHKKAPNDKSGVSF